MIVAIHAMRACLNAAPYIIDSIIVVNMHTCTLAILHAISSICLYITPQLYITLNTETDTVNLEIFAVKIFL